MTQILCASLTEHESLLDQITSVRGQVALQQLFYCKLPTSEVLGFFQHCITLALSAIEDHTRVQALWLRQR